MSSTEYVGPRPLDSPAPAAHRPTLGPGYDWLIELMRQLGRPAAFFLCLVAMLFQITAPPEARMDALTFGLFMGLLGALCGLRSVDIANARNAAGV